MRAVECAVYIKIRSAGDEKKYFAVCVGMVVIVTAVGTFRKLMGNLIKACFYAFIEHLITSGRL